MAEAIIRIDKQLLVSLDGDLDDRAFLDMQDALSAEVERTGASGVLLDVSGMTMLDSFLARALAKTVHLVRLMGAEAVLVGVQPAVAITLVDLGLDLGGLPTALNAGRGIGLLKRLQADGSIAN